jgi:L-amino acid N-acyltransferase YncA
MTTDIRLATAGDGSALATIYAPAVESQATSFELEPPDASEMARRVVAVTARTPWLVCVHRGAVIGYAYATPHRDRPAYAWSAEVSAYVDATSQRVGVGKALYNSLFAVLSLQGFRSAYAGITLPNAASVRFHESAGFTPVGVYHDIGYKFGRWHDVAWFERALGPHDTEARPPRPISEITADASFIGALRTGLPCVRLERGRPTVA